MGGGFATKINFILALQGKQPQSGCLDSKDVIILKMNCGAWIKFRTLIYISDDLHMSYFIKV